MEKQKLTAFINDSSELAINLEWAGVAFEPADEWALIFTAKDSDADLDSAAVFQKASGAGVTVSGSVATVELVPSDTELLTDGRRLFDVQAQNILTQKVRTVAFGEVYIMRDITRLTETSVPVLTSQDPLPFARTAVEIHAATTKATPVDADELGFWDSVSGLLRKATWANIKATLKTYFDTIYSPINHNHSFSDLSGTPTTLAGYGITDAATSDQGSKADTALQPADIASGTITPKVGDLNFGGLVESTQLSATGGANKIPIFGATGDLTTGPFATNDDIGGLVGNIWFPDCRGPRWLKRDGTDSGAKIFMRELHDVDGGELYIQSPHRVVLIQGEQGAIQLGLTRATDTVSFTYLQQRYDATALVPLGESQPLFFNATWWNGSSKVPATGFVGIQGRVRASDGQEELILFANSTFPDSHTATDATMPEIVAVTPEGLRDPGNYPTFDGLTDQPTVTVTCSKTKASQNSYVTLAGNRTLAFASAEPGMRGTILVSQDSVGSRTMTLPSNSATQSGFALSAAAYKVDKIEWVYSGTDYYFTIEKDFILPVDADAQTFLTAASISAASTEGIAINNLVKQLKADDVWDELIAAYPVVGGSSTAHSKDLKSAYNGTFGAGVTHDADGITGTAASTSWLNTGINVSALGAKDSIGMYAYCKTSAWTDSGRLFGTSTTNGRLYISRSGTTLLGHGPCSGTLNTASVVSVSDYRGHYWWGRTSSTSATIRFNASSQTATDSSNAAPTEPITFLGQNAGGGTVSNPTNANLAFCAVTTGNIDSTKWTALKAAVDAFEAALGRQN